MDLNIALNTLIYVLILLLPGLLFRRFYFSGQFSKQFYQANLLERFLWTLLSGVGVIVAFLFLIALIRNLFDGNFLVDISYKNLYELHTLLVEEKLPTEDKILKIYDDLFLFVTLVYAFSCFLGFILHYTVVFLGLDNIFSVLRFQNRWYYILNGKLYSPKKFKRIRTNADVLVDVSTGEQLYSGIVRDYFIDPKTNRLDSIVLSESYRWSKQKNEKKKKKLIPGHSLIIEGSRIINVNFYYEGFLGNAALRNSIFDTIASVSFIITSLSLIIIEYLYFDSFYLGNWFRRIIFFVFSIFSFVSFFMCLERIIKNLPEDQKQPWRGLLGFFVCSITPLILLYFKVSFLGVIGFSVFFIFIFPIAISWLERKKNK